jgi:CMP-N,N'-diacetyllegionaminic acid synthase
MATMLVVVPARGGSKRLPGKNLRPLAGRSLIEWTAQSLNEAALDAECLLTTDDTEIAAAGRKVGWLVPFLRPADLSRDETPTVDAVVHALDWYRAERGADPDLIVLLQVTSPLRNSADIRATVALMQRESADAVVTMKPYEDGRFGCWVKGTNGFIRRTEVAAEGEAYEPNGAIYVIRTDVLLEGRNFYPPRTIVYVMPAARSIDVDTADDWRRAEALLGTTA